MIHHLQLVIMVLYCNQFYLLYVKQVLAVYIAINVIYALLNVFITGR